MTGGMGDLALAFAAGVVSFLSPCVLPLVPAYLSVITGMAPSELGANERPARAVLVPSLLFVLGFSIVFVGLGVLASALGSTLSEYTSVIQRVLGLFVFAMGFFLLGIIKLPWLYGEARFEMGKARAFGRGAAVVMGMAFAFGWTPCVGPILGVILGMTISGGDVARGALLLSFYSAGLGVPLVLVGMLFGRMRATLSWLNQHSLTISRVAGGLLMVLGLLLFFDQLGAISSWFLDVLPSVELL